MASQKPCANCKLRAKHDQNPQSFIGRVWRWHINFCPGWKSYLNSLSDEERAAVCKKYNYNR